MFALLQCAPCRCIFSAFARRASAYCAAVASTSTAHGPKSFPRLTKPAGCFLLPVRPLQEEDLAAEASGRLFRGLVFFLSREVPREALSFVIRSCGGEVAWEGEGSPLAEADDAVTHHVCDRPKQGHRFIGREYVQPQWVFDSVNFKILCPVRGITQFATTSQVYHFLSELLVVLPQFAHVAASAVLTSPPAERAVHAGNPPASAPEPLHGQRR